MSDDLEWAKIRRHKSTAMETAGRSALRITLLFGGLAIALGLFVTPFLDRDSDSRVFANYGNGVDTITTAGTRKRSGNTYTIRRSVLQQNPTGKCIIRANGFKTGDC